VFGGVTWKRFFLLLIVYSGLKFCPAFWKMLAFECRIEISEISLRFTLKETSHPPFQ